MSNDLMRAAPEPDPPDFFEVSLANLPIPVRVEYSAIRDLRAGFDGNGEGMGLLLGSISPEALYIQHCELLALAPATLGNPKSLQGAFQQFARARLQTPLKEAPQLLGGFRTQMTGWSGLRDADIEIAKRSFPGSDPLFLSIRTTERRPWMASLYALDARAAKGSTAAIEFPFDEYLLRNGYLTALVETPEAADAPVPQNPRQQQRDKTHWIVAGVVLAVVLGASGAAYKWYRPVGLSDVSQRSLPGLGPLSLKVNRSGSDFEVTWDRLSAAVQQSSSGSLTINDGALTRVVALTGAQLREGRVLYTPLFQELTFRLEVTAPDLGTGAESVQVLAWSGRQASDVLTVGPSGQLTSMPPAGVAQTKLPTPAPLAPKAESQRKDSVPIAPAPVAKSAPAPVPAANNGKQAQSAKVSSPQITSVLQPLPLNSKQREDIAPAPPVHAPEPPPPVVASERPPVTQPPAQVPANPPAAPPAAAPAPKPVAPPPTESSPAVSGPSLPPAAPPTVVPTATPVPAAAPAKPAGAGITVSPVPSQRVAPVRPTSLATGAGTRSSRMVSVRVMIDTSGSVQSAQVVASTPPGAFGEALLKDAALNAAKRWKFRPGQVDGKNVTAEYTIDFQFQ